MPIGEFGGAPPLVAEGSPALTTPMYWMYEMAHASLNPARAVTDATKILFQNPLNPLSHTEFGKSVAAGCEVFERATRRYGKPSVPVVAAVSIMEAERGIEWFRSHVITKVPFPHPGVM